jgi:hypothetical protein
VSRRLVPPQVVRDSPIATGWGARAGPSPSSPPVVCLVLRAWLQTSPAGGSYPTPLVRVGVNSSSLLDRGGFGLWQATLGVVQVGRRLRLTASTLPDTVAATGVRTCMCFSVNNDGGNEPRTAESELSVYYYLY